MGCKLRLRVIKFRSHMVAIICSQVSQRVPDIGCDAADVRQPRGMSAGVFARWGICLSLGDGLAKCTTHSIVRNSEPKYTSSKVSPSLIFSVVTIMHHSVTTSRGAVLWRMKAFPGKSRCLTVLLGDNVVLTTTWWCHSPVPSLCEEILR